MSPPHDPAASCGGLEDLDHILVGYHAKLTGPADLLAVGRPAPWRTDFGAGPIPPRSMSASITGREPVQQR